MNLSELVRDIIVVQSLEHLLVGPSFFQSLLDENRLSVVEIALDQVSIGTRTIRIAYLVLGIVPRVSVIVTSGRYQSLELQLPSLAIRDFLVPPLEHWPNSFRHETSIERLHGSREGRVDLEEIGRALAFRDVDAGLVESSGVEKHCVSSLQLELDQLGFDEVDVLGSLEGEVSLLVLMRVWHEAGGTSGVWHVGMRNGGLKREKLIGNLGDKGESLYLVQRLMRHVYSKRRP